MRKLKHPKPNILQRLIAGRLIRDLERENEYLAICLCDTKKRLENLLAGRPSERFKNLK